MNVDYDFNDWADRLNQIADEIGQRIELEKRIEGHNLRTPLKTLIKNLVRDRRFAEDMKLILKAGGTHYRGQPILGSENEPYIKLTHRRHVKAELTFDLDNRLGSKPEE